MVLWCRKIVLHFQTWDENKATMNNGRIKQGNRKAERETRIRKVITGWKACTLSPVGPVCSIEAKEEIERRLRKETRLTVKKLARWAKKHVNGNGENNAPLAGEMKSWPKAEKLKIGTNSSLKENCAENEWKRRTSAIVLYRVSRIVSLLQNQKTNFYLFNPR